MRFLLTTIFIVAFYISSTSLFSQENGFKYSANINKDSFPKVVIDFNLRNPTIKEADDFSLVEGGKPISFSFEKTSTNRDSAANKNVLILVENLNQRDRQNFYKNVLDNSLPFIINPGDKFNIAVFDRVREGGKKTIYLLLDEYTDDKQKLKDAINSIEARNDKFGNNKSSDLYYSIYDGLKELNESFKENRYLFVLSSAFNNKWSGHTSFQTSQSFAVKHNIPVYSIQYRIPGGEAHKLTPLVEETYGDEVIGRESNGAAVSLSKFMTGAYAKSLGQNYRISYTTSFPKDGNEYKAQLSVEGKTYDIDIQTPQPSFLENLWNKYRYYTIAGILLSLALLGLLLRSISKSKQKDKVEKTQLASAINTAQRERERATSQLEFQNRELQQMKRDKEKQEQFIAKKKMNKKLLQEMKISGALPVINYSVGGSTRKYRMEKPMIKIGRADENDIIIKDGTVSRSHAEIYFSGGQYFIRDIESTHGTKVNGKKITGTMVNHNDIIQLGKTQITFIK